MSISSSRSCILYFILIGSFFFSCRSTRIAGNTTKITSQRTHISFDDSELHVQQSPLIMPYNRLAEPAGSTVRFGDPNLENHSLDLTLLPDHQHVVVEDRYGIIVFDIASHEAKARYSFSEDKKYSSLMSSFSGIKVIEYNGGVNIFWSAGAGNKPDSYVMQALWDGKQIKLIQAIHFNALTPAATALPNELEVRNEAGVLYLYVVLNGNNQLIKMQADNQQIAWTAPTGVAPYGITIVNNSAYVSNWGGPVPSAVNPTNAETAGVPWGNAYIDPRTGATAQGTVSVIDLVTGAVKKEIQVGLHPNAIIHSPDNLHLYVANGNSDYISVIKVSNNEIEDSIPIQLYGSASNYIGATPNALAFDSSGATLYIANGLNNAIAVTVPDQQQHFRAKGFIPTEVYPAGIVCSNNMLVVANLEGNGARVNSDTIIKARKPEARRGDLPADAFNSHRQLASISFIPVPLQAQLSAYTQKVKQLNLEFREMLSRQLPRQGILPQPVPERIGEPSVFKHVVYIIKENRTYDQVLGDMIQGKGMSSLCIFGDSITPNQHQLAKDFLLLDNYYVSGKCSAEGHQWADAAMVTDYIEKNVRAWFRSYPHAQYDAMVYDKEGFIWNNALDHGKTVRIYGEACTTEMDKNLDWTKVYQIYLQHQALECKNISTISRVRPILSQSYPGYDDPRINDQLRAEAFIKDLQESVQRPGDDWPQLMVLSLPNDHTTGMNPGYPTPRAMVADNDLALGRIIEAINKSRFWGSTAIFVTEDDSQSGWDHISAYRTTGFIISPYSRLEKTIHTNYNQTCMVRTIEQILGLPPMNTIDATALPLFDCFNNRYDTSFFYKVLPNHIPLNEMNQPLSQLRGKALHYANLSIKGNLTHIDEGDDDIFNRVLWFTAKGTERYPEKYSYPSF